jgi:hypothetical protein
MTKVMLCTYIGAKIFITLVFQRQFFRRKSLKIVIIALTLGVLPDQYIKSNNET